MQRELKSAETSARFVLPSEEKLCCVYTHLVVATEGKKAVPAGRDEGLRVGVQLLAKDARSVACIANIRGQAVVLQRSLPVAGTAGWKGSTGGRGRFRITLSVASILAGKTQGGH